MTRRAAKITEDEVRRLVKAATACGLSVGRIVFDGSEVSIVIGGESGEIRPLPSGQDNAPTRLFREPKL